MTTNLRFLFLLSIILCGLSIRQARANDSSGLSVSASVDALAVFKGSSDSTANNRLDIREAEVILFGPIDHIFSGQLSLAAHREDGVSLFEIHEAYIGSEKLIPRTNIRAGQYFLGIGRLNRFHRHEWPFVSAPKIHRQLFGGEGLLDSGVEATVLAPTSFYLDMTLGVSNGWVFGHSHDEGKKPKSPTVYSRIAGFSEIGESGGAQFGLTGLTRKDDQDLKTNILGLDVTAKWRSANYLKYLVQSETWLRQLDPGSGAPKENVLGSYLLFQYGFNPRYFLGLRTDFYTVLSLEDAAGSKLKNNEIGINPVLTWKPSEFSTFRLGALYENLKTDNTSDPLRDKKRLSYEVQISFNLGAHPAHDF